MKNQALSARNLVLTALFTAIIFLMAFTPLGLINLPVIKATILHVPVIIGSVLLGPKIGAYLGAVFGVCSFIVNSYTPSLLSFAFSPAVPLPGSSHGTPWAVVICFVPRILVGVLPWFICRGLEKLLGKAVWAKTIQYAVAGAAGAIANTILVMGLIGTTLSGAFAAAKGISHDMVMGGILSIILANGIPEAIAGAVLTAAVCLALDRAFKGKTKFQGGEKPA